MSPLIQTCMIGVQLLTAAPTPPVVFTMRWPDGPEGRRVCELGAADMNAKSDAKGVNIRITCEARVPCPALDVPETDPGPEDEDHHE